MADDVDKQNEQKLMKRFNSYEEFLKAFYPKSTEEKAKESSENDGFGVELALNSLNRHASILRFRDH
jgi:hypothetical protein